MYYNTKSAPVPSTNATTVDSIESQECECISKNSCMSTNKALSSNQLQ